MFDSPFLSHFAVQSSLRLAAYRTTEETNDFVEQLAYNSKRNNKKKNKKRV